MLDEVAVPLSKGEVLSPHLLSWLEGWELLMCRVPPVGHVVTKTDGKREDYFFHGGLQPLKALTRSIMLSGNALLDVGKMLADTYIYREMEAKRQASSGTKSIKTYGRLESAGTLRQKGNPAPSSYPTRVNGSEGSHNAPEGNNDGKSSQGHPVSEAVKSR